MEALFKRNTSALLIGERRMLALTCSPGTDPSKMTVWLLYGGVGMRERHSLRIPLRPLFRWGGVGYRGRANGAVEEGTRPGPTGTSGEPLDASLPHSG